MKNEYKTCPVSHACYNQHKGTYESIFNHVDCFNMECLMRHDPEACARYFSEEAKRKEKEYLEQCKKKIQA